MTLGKATNERAMGATGMQIHSWPIEKLVPYRRNPRKNDKAVDRMVASIKEFGFKIPILARSSGEIVDGHLRYKAAQVLQMKEVPVILCDEPEGFHLCVSPPPSEPLGDMGRLGHGYGRHRNSGTERPQFRPQPDIPHEFALAQN